MLDSTENLIEATKSLKVNIDLVLGGDSNGSADLFQLILEAIQCRLQIQSVNRLPTTDSDSEILESTDREDRKLLGELDRAAVIV